MENSQVPKYPKLTYWIFILYYCFKTLIIIIIIVITNKPKFILDSVIFH